MFRFTRRFFTAEVERALLVEKSDKGIVTFNLNRPKVRNAISRAFVTQVSLITNSQKKDPIKEFSQATLLNTYLNLTHNL
jgi:hypothetical protein